MKNQTGAYAFPQSNDRNEMHSDYNGMMLRDYFAAKEKAVITSAYWTIPSFQAVIRDQATKENKSHQALMCEMAYSEADAMLKQREL